MALAGELANYIGNEIVKTGGKELAKAGAESALSSLLPSMATKAVSRDIPVIASKSLAQAINVGKPEMVDIYRGISAKSDDELASYLRQMIDKNVKPTTYGGGSMQGEGYNFSTGRDVAEYFANRVPQRESRAVLHTRVPKNRFINQNAQIGNRLVDFQIRAEGRGIPYENGDSARQAEKDMQRYFNKNGLLGIKSNSGETYVINQNDDAWLNNLDVFSASKGRGTRIEPDDNLLSTLRSILPQKEAKPVIDYEIPSSIKERVGKYIDGVVKAKPTLDAPATNSPDINIDTKLGRLVDNSGKPITFYHSTPYEFDKFDDSKLGQNTNYTNTALGHFVTTDKDFSKRFIDIDNVGKTGKTMELQAKVNKPVTHPYLAGRKYPQEQLDDILKNWIKAISKDEKTANEIIQDYVNAANETREVMESSGQVYDTKSPLWDEYMNQTFMDTDPYEYSADDREGLLRNGYDAVEIVEGLKNELVDGSTDTKPISSYAILNGDNLRKIKHLPIEKTTTENVDLSSLDTPLFKEFGSEYDIDLFKRAKSGDILTAEEIENSPFRQALEKKADDAEALYGEEIITKDMSDGTYPIPTDVANRMNVMADEVLSKANQNPNIAHNRQAVIFMGGPSSGKSSAGMKLYDAEKGGDYFVLDSDDVKPMFEEFGNGEGAGITHEASVYVTNSIVKPALMAEGTNLAIPVVGKTEKSLYRNIQELVDAGYNVSVVLTELPVEKAASRNFTRMLETGRNVADGYVRHTVGDKPLEVYKKLVSDINNGVVEGVSGYARVNNDVPFGSSPILVDYSGDSDILRPLIEKLGVIQ